MPDKVPDKVTKLVLCSYHILSYFTYMGMTLTDKNCMHKEIKCVLIPRNVFYNFM